MKQFIVTLFAVMMIGFGAQAQHYFYGSTTRVSDGVTLTVEVETTGIEIVNNGGGCTYRIKFNTNIKFFKDTIEMTSNLPVINNLKIIFECSPISIASNVYSPDYSIPRNLGQNIGLLTSNMSMTGVNNCNNLSIESLMCDRAKITIGFHNGGNGHSNTIWVDGTSTLPIELISFDAYKKDREVELAWKTASELNNDYFTIERSVDGTNWENIQTVRGAGSSSQVLEYTATDHSPYAGISYYRLSQTDYDGTTEMFNIVSVEQDEVEELQAYPNPVSHTATILGIKNDQEVRVFNTVGVEVSGNVIITNSPSKKTFIDMSQLPNGMYYVTNGGKRIQLVKQ